MQTTLDSDHTCRRCRGCAGRAHHWLADCEEVADPTYTHVCQHCAAVGFECDWCDGSGYNEEDNTGETLCALCHGDGVLFVKDLARCATCDVVLDVPPREHPLVCTDCRAHP